MPCAHHLKDLNILVKFHENPLKGIEDIQETNEMEAKTFDLEV